MSYAGVNDDMKVFNITKQISGRESEKDLRYFAQQAEKCISQQKYRVGQGEDLIVPTWKDILFPWFIPDERASKFLRKKEATSPTTLFDLLITRNAPKVRDFSVSFLELVCALVKPESFDDHQVTIEKFLDDLVDRRLKDNLVTQLIESLDLTKIAPFSNDLNKNVQLRENLQIALNDRIRGTSENLVLNEVKKVLGSEIAMSIIGADPSLFTPWKDGKPIDATLSQLVNFAQEKFLDQEQPVADKLICLRYNNNAKSPIVTKADIEKSNKRKIELSNITNEKAQKTVTTQSPQQATKETKPADAQPKPIVKSGKEVAVPCALCLVSSDTKKKEKACFHVYENCFDHPTFGEKNRNKFKFSKGKKSSKK
ncbi:MAG TPA: hypothetical protein VGD31_08050 [Sphingobacteriaceae bacterium]